MALKEFRDRVYYRTIDLDQTFREAKRELEKAMLLRHMDRSKGNITKASKSLGLSRPTLYEKLDKYKIKF